MGDAVRPSKTAYEQAISQSSGLWESYLDSAKSTSQLPLSCIDLKAILERTPTYLGNGLISKEFQPSLAYYEKISTYGNSGLLISGSSKWATSNGNCFLEPKSISSHLLLGVQSPIKIQISDRSPLAEWPGTQGLSGYDEGNYLAVLFVAWAYILSARWAELLEASTDQRCEYRYATVDDLEDALRTDLSDIPIDLRPGVEEHEAEWWNAIFSGKGWEITTKYKERVYHSPWAVSAFQQVSPSIVKNILMASTELPSSGVALEYLNRFCAYHRLYGQCSAALAGVLYIPLLGGSSASLPMIKPLLRLSANTPTSCSTEPFPVPKEEQGKILAQCMTLSSNVWGMRSLLCSSFFNPDIDCNLVSAWLNPAFAIMDPLIEDENFSVITKIMAARDPKLGSIWLGALLVGIVKSTIRDIRNGLTAIDLNAGAWTGTEQSFLMSQPRATDGETINREDECRLLFLTGLEGHNRVPTWPWKPFGETRLCDTEPTVQCHAHCGCHVLNYIAWVWTLSDGKEVEDPGNRGIGKIGSAKIHSHTPERVNHSPVSVNNSIKSQLLSEAATRGIFGWLRSTGYPANEKAIYQHSWIDIESSDEESMDDSESDTAGCAKTKRFVDEWLSQIN